MFRYSTWLVAAALVLLAAMPAFAQSYPGTVTVQNQVTTNNCSAAEPVALSGNLNLQYSFSTDSNGVNHFTVDVANSLTGVGQNSGGTYTAGDSNQYQVDSSQPTGELTVEFRSDLAPQNGGTGMTLIQSLDITVDTGGNINGTVLSNTTTCGSAS
jgi:hypothetical protein